MISWQYARRLRRGLCFTSILALFLFFSASLLFAISCGEELQQTDLSSGDKIGYIAKSGTRCSLMLTTTTGGEGQSLMEWPGDGERFSFSNDGRFFSLLLSRKPYTATDSKSTDLRYLYASTDGERAYLSDVPACFSFSPDSTRIAYITLPINGINELGIIDVKTGTSKTLNRGSVMINPAWINDSNIIYTGLKDTAVLTNQKGGIVYRQNVDSSAATQLTPDDRSFSTYSAPVSFSTSKVILTEKETLNNLWSLDVDNGLLRQVTNNNLFQFRANYLPASNRILFEELKTVGDNNSSELCLMSDDGTDFRMLTTNFIFDGLSSYSLDGQKIVYQQQTDEGRTSIWSVNHDGSGETRITGSDTLWLGDPNFAPVAAWQVANPLEMEVSENGIGEPLVVSIRNTSNAPVESVLRAFSGIDLLLNSTGGSAPVQAAGGTDPGSQIDTDRTGPKLEWRIRLEPGESTEIDISATTRPTIAASREASLLLTLAVPDTPPRMYWQAFE